MINSPEEFVELRTSDDLTAQDRASREAASMETWLGVIAAHPEMREWVAHNKTVPLEILDLLAKDPDPRVRRTVASKRKLGPALLRSLASDHDEIVRAVVARHRRTEAVVLRALAGDDSWVVRAAAEHNIALREPE